MRRQLRPRLFRALTPAGLTLACALAGLAAFGLSPHFGGPPLG